MKKSCFAAFWLMATAIFATSAHSVLIDNGTTTLDTATGLEWLDVDLTAGQAYTSIIGDFGGYMSAGYRYANANEICGLFGALGDVVTDCASETGTIQSIASANADTLVSLLGDTFIINGPAYFGVVCGRYDDGNAGDGNIGAASVKASATNGHCQQAAPDSVVYTIADNINITSNNSYIGSFLVRETETVPEPGGLAILMAGLAGVAAIRRRKQAA